MGQGVGQGVEHVVEEEEEEGGRVFLFDSSAAVALTFV